MKIKDLLDDKPPETVTCIGPEATLAETAQCLLDHRIGALVVVGSDRRPLGIVSERDLIPVLANYESDRVHAPVSEVMTKRLVTCSLQDDVGYVLRLMRAHRIRHMPVLEDGRLIDVVSIRKLSRAYDALQVEANTDPLTELSNRRPFLKTMHNEFVRAKRTRSPLTVAMIDLDHFKQVNDRYGHDAGDEVLRKVSSFLILEFRSIDLIGRLGGEEFAVVFPGTDAEGARVACERLRQVIATTPIAVDGHDIFITASFGIAWMTKLSRDEAAVLKNADKALYAAKSAGRNQIQMMPPDQPLRVVARRA